MEGFPFSVSLTVRISDLNYANHVGYQNYLSYFQESRLAYLNAMGFSEMDIGGCGIVVAEALCRYKRELFLYDSIQIGCRINQLRSKGFRCEHQIRRQGILCAEGYTDCLSYDHGLKAVVKLPEPFIAAVKDHPA